MKMIRTAYLVCRARKPAVTTRIRARKKTMVGIWKMRPKATVDSPSVSALIDQGVPEVPNIARMPNAMMMSGQNRHS